jgi:hypothetical protein
VGYEASTHRWTILRTGTFDKYLTKRMVVVCSSYKWGDHEQVTGVDACHLVVGRLIVPNPLPGPAHRADFINVDEMPDEVLAITEGDGPDRVSQLFNIVSYQVVEP